MGTVIQSGSCTGVVVATGGNAEFGRIALGLGERQPETQFQAGLRRFSVLLLEVALALTSFSPVTQGELRGTALVNVVLAGCGRSVRILPTSNRL